MKELYYRIRDYIQTEIAFRKAKKEAREKFEKEGEYIPF